MKRILIVDDALELGRLLQTVFLTLDATLSIQVVPSAEEALLESSRKPIDLLVSDIRLPGMSGFDLVKKIRARHPSLRVMVITGMTDPGLIDRAHEMKVEGFFHKPLDMAGFIETARHCLDLPGEEVRKLAAQPELRQFVAPGSATQVSLSALITGLRQRLGAQSVFLLDKRGHVQVNAGEVPDLPLENQWIGPVMSALSAGHKLARLVGEGLNEQVLAIPGSRYQLVLAPAGDYALLILMAAGPSGLRLALAVEEALVGQRELARILVELGVKKAPVEPHPAPAPAVRPQEKHAELPSTAPIERAETAAASPAVQPVPEPDAEVSLDEFEASLKRSEQELKNKDIDRFWDTVTAGQPSGTPANPEGLTYEQARKLGLTPKDDK